MSQNVLAETHSDLCNDSAQGVTLVDILRWRAHHQLEQQAYMFLKNGESEESNITYAQLDQKARCIATMLRKQVAVGARALLLYQPGLEYIAAFFGCLYAGVIAVPAYPPSSNRSFLRIQAIAADAQPGIALTSQYVLLKAQQWATSLPTTFRWIATDILTEEFEEVGQSYTPEPEMLAFLQYTSGSTGTPKGVMVSHSNLMHNLAMMQECWGCGAHSVGVSWLPIFHDMGLIAGVLLPLYTGFPAVLMAPAAFIQHPMRWLQALSRYKGTISCAPNFAYSLCVQKFKSQEHKYLDLRSWSVAINGAEPVRSETIEQFIETFAAYGFQPAALMPAYGLAEATLVVSCTPRSVGATIISVDQTYLAQYHVVSAEAGSSTTHTLVGCGAYANDQRVIIVDSDTHRECQQDRVGEIWLSGPSVTQGYWQRTEETKDTFRALLTDSLEGPFLRTGDLGFIYKGDVFITGRLKDLIIICGRNYYPQDIELSVEQAHVATRASSGAAFSLEVEGEEHLVVVQELDRKCRHQDLEEVFAAIHRTVWECHKLAVYAIALIQHGSIPKTSSGKIQRRACRQDFLAEALKIIEVQYNHNQMLDMYSKSDTRISWIICAGSVS